MSFNHWKALSTSELPPVIQCTASPERLKLLYHTDNQRCWENTPVMRISYEPGAVRPGPTAGRCNRKTARQDCVEWHGANTSPDGNECFTITISDNASLCLCQGDQGNSVIVCKNKLHRVPLRLNYLIGRSRTHHKNTSKHFGVPGKIKWLCL